MFCNKCGNQLDDNSKFCKKCGAKVENNTKEPNNTPNKDHNHKKTRQEKKEEKKAKRAGWTTGEIVRRYLIKTALLIILIVAVVALANKALMYLGIVDTPVFGEFLNKPQASTSIDEEDEDEQYVVEFVDADKYFEENTKVISKFKVEDSIDVKTESETSKNLEERGFTDFEIFSDYSMSGEYIDEKPISDTSEEKHPDYHAYYVTESGLVWTLHITNNEVRATPVSYNMQSTLEAQVTLAESEVVIGYDNITNMFYETIPNKSLMIVKVVDEITAEFLEGLTLEEIDGL
jgi:hypothetical protein